MKDNDERNEQKARFLTHLILSDIMTADEKNQIHLTLNDLDVIKEIVFNVLKEHI